MKNPPIKCGKWSRNYLTIGSINNSLAITMTLSQLRQQLNRTLWDKYCAHSLDMQAIDSSLNARRIFTRPLDHFAIIDLPGPYTGIPFLHDLFAAIGYVKKGNDYLADKQNDFLWLAERDCEQKIAHDVLPQIVVADFRLAELPHTIRSIIEKYNKHATSPPFAALEKLIHAVELGNAHAITTCTNLILNYLNGRDWPMPTIKDYQTVRAFNELLAWVLVFGRRPNHFTLSIHLMNEFIDLADFNDFIEQEVKLSLNQEGGSIKGGAHTGIAQGSTLGVTQSIHLADGTVEIATGFVEFVWRYAVKQTLSNPPRWEEYFTGFIAQHANKVIESLWVTAAG